MKPQNSHNASGKVSVSQLGRELQNGEKSGAFCVMKEPRVKTVFLSCQDDLQGHELEAYCNSAGELYICISDKEEGIVGNQWTVLNKETAKALVKHLNKEIKLMPDE